MVVCVVGCGSGDGGEAGVDAGGGRRGAWAGDHGDGTLAISFRVDEAGRVADLIVGATGGACGNGSSFELYAAGPAEVAADGTFVLASTVDDAARSGCGVDGSCARIELRGHFTPPESLN